MSFQIVPANGRVSGISGRSIRSFSLGNDAQNVIFTSCETAVRQIGFRRRRRGFQQMLERSNMLCGYVFKRHIRIFEQQPQRSAANRRCGFPQRLNLPRAVPDCTKLYTGLCITLQASLVLSKLTRKPCRRLRRLRIQFPQNGNDLLTEAVARISRVRVRAVRDEILSALAQKGFDFPPFNLDERPE